jgi:hypothetical protein
VAVALVALLFLAAAGFVVAGIAMLAGMAWAFVATGCFLFAAALHLRMVLNG